MSKELLIVDDSSTIRMALRMFLKGKPWTLVDAENGRVALEILATRSFDLIVTDLNMPEVDGFELIDRARKLPSASRTPIVVMTSRDAEADVERAFTSGATSFVNKPLQQNELISVLERHLGTG